MAEQHCYTTPEAAETAFYEAFAARDLNAMMSVWVNSDDIVCIHPMSERLTGRVDIAASWAQIFRGDGVMRFELANAIQITTDTISVHYVHEEISFGKDLGDRSRVLATNVYINTESGWRIQAHHGSPGMSVAPQATPSPPITVH